MKYLARKRCTRLSQIAILDKSHSGWSGAPRPYLRHLHVRVSSIPLKDGGGRELTAAGMTPSVGSVGDSCDNALAESMIGLYKTEVIAHQGPWRDLAQVETATATWVGWFSQQRLFWPIGRRPPAEYEQACYAGELDPAAPAAGSKTPGKSTRKTKKTT